MNFLKIHISSKSLLILGLDAASIERLSNELISATKYSFSKVRSLKCSEISAQWIKDFDYTIAIDEIDTVLFLPGIDVLPNFHKLIHYCQDLELEVFWIPLTSASQGVWLTPKKIFGAPFLGFENLKMTLLKF